MFNRRIFPLMVVGIALFLVMQLPSQPTMAQQQECPARTRTVLALGNSAQALRPIVLHQDLNPTGGAMLDPNSPVISHVDAGSIFQVLDGPFCARSSAWWRIQSEIGTRGWIAETDANGPVAE